MNESLHNEMKLKTNLLSILSSYFICVRMPNRKTLPNHYLADGKTNLTRCISVMKQSNKRLDAYMHTNKGKLVLLSLSLYLVKFKYFYYFAVLFQ